MAQYKGTSQDAARAATLAKTREKERKRFEENQKKIKDSVGGLRDINEAFQTHTSVYEEQFKASTVGLVSAEEFKKKRDMVDQMIVLEAKNKKKAKKQAKKMKEKRRKKALTSLSFDVEEAPDDETGVVRPDKVSKKKIEKESRRRDAFSS